jgi:hypothetical protein
MARRVPRTLAALALAGLLAGCDNYGNGASATRNDVKGSPAAGPSVSFPGSDIRAPSELVSPNNGRD